MKRNFWLGVVNIGLKAVGSIYGAVIFLGTDNNKLLGNSSAEGPTPIAVAVLAGYCALGYMFGNLVSALVVPLVAEITGEKDTEKVEKENTDNTENTESKLKTNIRILAFVGLFFGIAANLMLIFRILFITGYEHSRAVRKMYFFFGDVGYTFILIAILVSGIELYRSKSKSKIAFAGLLCALLPMLDRVGGMFLRIVR